MPRHFILYTNHRLTLLYPLLDTDLKNAQDSRRMAEINKEIGLENVLQGMGMGRTDSGGETSSSGEDEKKGGFGRVSEAKEIESIG